MMLNINGLAFQYLECTNLNLMQKLVKDVCNYWEQGNWSFSYIDSIARYGSKVFELSNNVKIKTDVLYLIMKVSISYNRWYAMRIVRNLFKDVMKDMELQTNLAMRLNEKRLNIITIFSGSEEFPPLINEIYKE